MISSLRFPRTVMALPGGLADAAPWALRDLAQCRARSNCRWRPSGVRAVTLVEVLIAVALIAILSGTVLFGSGVLGGSRERAAASLIVSAVRMGLARANTTGRPVRMVFDLDNHSLTLEETSSLRMAREKDDAESPAAGADPVTELEREAEEEAQEVIEGPRAPRPQFSPVQEFRAQEEGESAGRGLGQGVSFRFVQTEHDSEERTSGRAYLYFWPGGETEHAVVHLGRGDSNGLTVRISALTGRAKIEKGRAALPEPRADGEISEREEE